MRVDRGGSLPDLKDQSIVCVVFTVYVVCAGRRGRDY